MEVIRFDSVVVAPGDFETALNFEFLGARLAVDERHFAKIDANNDDFEVGPSDFSDLEIWLDDGGEVTEPVAAIKYFDLTNEDTGETFTVMLLERANNLNILVVIDPSSGLVSPDPLPVGSYSVFASDFNGPILFEAGTDNTDPIAADFDVDTDEDTSVSVPIFDNVSDEDGDSLEVELGAAENGEVFFDGEEFRYTPDENFNGLDTFEYSVDDGQGGIASAIVSINVNPINDDPEAEDDSDEGFETNEDTAFTTASVLANDSDVDGDTLTVDSFDTTGTLGQVSYNGDGTFDYDPNGAFESLAAGDVDFDTFSYEIDDGNGGSDTATVTVTVTGVNDDPDAVDEDGVGFETDEDTAFTTASVLLNDSDVDGDTLSVVSLDTTGTTGQVTDNGDGTFDYDPNGAFESLAAGDVDFDTFSYEISDGNGGSDTATVTVTVNGVNDEPDADDDEGVGFETDEDTAFTTASVLANDSDVDGDTLTVDSFDTTGTLGQVSYNGDGTFDYDPNGAFESLAVGDVDFDTFSYEIDDGNGGSDTATVTVTVNGVNDDPDAVDEDGVGFETDEDTAFTTASVLLNDSDVDLGDVLAVADYDTVGTNGGQISYNGDGTFDYDPNGAFESLAAGDVDFDTFSYEISDGNGGFDTATVTVTVNGVNDGPVANDDSVEGDEDNSIVIDLASLVSDVDSTNLLINPNDPSNGDLVNNGDGTWTYTPDQDFNGTDGFAYSVSDGDISDNGEISIEVTPVNDDPDARDDRFTLMSGQSLFISAAELLDNDVDVDEDSLALVGNSTPSEGNITSAGAGGFTYNPGDFVGETSFTYSIGDGNGGRDTATIFLTVQEEPNTPPVADDFDVEVDEDRSVGVDILANASDADGDELEVELGDPSNGTVEFDGEEFRYTPDDDFNGEDRFEYAVSDGKGGMDTGIVTVTVNPINDDPDALDDDGAGFETNEDTAFTTGSVLLNDSDVDGHTLSVVSLDTTGTTGQVTDNGDGTFDYDPNGAFESLAAGDVDFDTFSYEISDGNGGSDTATVTVTVNGVNDGPVANDDSVVGDEDNSIVIDLASLVSDVDSSNLLINPNDPSNGDLVNNGDGTWTYVPDQDFNGTDGFAYSVSDGDLSDNGEISIEVDPVNDAPELDELGPFSVDENTTEVGTITASDVDTASGDLTFSIIGGVDADLFDINADTGALSFKSAPDFELPGDLGGDNSYEVEVEVFDGQLTDDQFVFVNVQNVDEGPDVIEVTGSDGFDALVGTEANERIISYGGQIDQQTGGGGADTFVFGEETNNGVREFDYIYDFGADDSLDLGDRSIVANISQGSQTMLVLDGDFDTIILLGVNSFPIDQIA